MDRVVLVHGDGCLTLSLGGQSQCQHTYPSSSFSSSSLPAACPVFPVPAGPADRWRCQSLRLGGRCLASHCRRFMRWQLRCTSCTGRPSRASSLCATSCCLASPQRQPQLQPLRKVLLTQGPRRCQAGQAGHWTPASGGHWESSALGEWPPHLGRWVCSVVCWLVVFSIAVFQYPFILYLFCICCSKRMYLLFEDVHGCIRANALHVMLCWLVWWFAGCASYCLPVRDVCWCFGWHV